jgi:predicted MFS family arabinose efflux permease
MTNSMSVPDARPFGQRTIIISIAIGCMLVPLNSTMIAIALPQIMQDFRVDAGAAGWLVTSYLITMATLQLVAGKLGDQLGRRKFVLCSLIYFGFASLLAAVSSNLVFLLFARVQQAIAGAVLVTNGIALVFDIVPVERRGRDLGWVNAVIVLAAAGGPPLGGLLVGLGGWQAIFWANIPLIMSAFIIGWMSIPGDRLNTFRQHNTKSILHLQLAQKKTFVSANIAIALSNLAMYVTLLAIPILLSNRTGWTSLQTGLVLAAMSVTLAAFSPLGGRLSDRSGKRLPNLSGLALLTFGLLPLAILGKAISLSALLICLVLVGTGVGLCSVSLQTAALESVKRDQTGIASGISSTSRYLGSILGSGIITMLLGATQAENFKLIFLIAALAAMCAAIVSLGIRNQVPEIASMI